ncbi:hypothetical protein NC651_025940 [Populus alba x Populus x berolinensis]|nr:hypothetical protein NC651_025940 [Populus alba x Populus x berolinensis]
MSKKFGAGKQPTGTPSLGWSFVVAIVSLLAGASSCPQHLQTQPFESVDAAAKEKETGKKQKEGILWYDEDCRRMDDLLAVDSSLLIFTGFPSTGWLAGILVDLYCFLEQKLLV